MVLSRHKILLSFRANVKKEQTKYLSVIFKNDVFLPTDELIFFIMLCIGIILNVYLQR